MSGPRVRTRDGWASPGELERRQRREQERAEQREAQERRNERLRRTEFTFDPEADDNALVRAGWEPQ